MDNVTLFHKQAHSGPVSALDFNPSQPNLLASGATQGEILIWDVNNPEKPYSPGAKSARLEDLTSLAWNVQVSHILASASSNGSAVVWDLRSKRELLHLTNPTRKKFTSVAWNPEIPTQLLTASDDDSVPAIYMWDLRNAHAPEKVLNGHSKGVLSLSWSRKDSELLLSSGKDNRTLCWNPKTAEIIGEFPPSNNWVFDVQWCPKNPDVFSAASFDGKVSFYTVQTKSATEEEIAQSASDPFSAVAQKPFRLKQPPRWLRCPVGASFGFGNKLVSFVAKEENGVTTTKIRINQLKTDNSLVDSSKKLESILAENKLGEVCKQHITNAGSDELESSVWSFMDFINEEDARQKIVEYLGFDKEKISEQFASLSVNQANLSKSPKTVASGIVQDVFNGAMNKVDIEPSTDPFAAGGDFDLSLQPVITTDTNKVKTVNEALSATTGDVFEFYPDNKNTGADADITKCIIVGDFNSAVELCLKNDRLDDALILAIHGGQTLLERTKAEFYRRKKNTASYLRISACLSNGNIQDIVRNANVSENWKETMALICTFAQPEELSKLTSELGDRILDDSDIVKDSKKKKSLQNAAVLSYMIAGRLDKLVGIWIDQYQNNIQPINQKFLQLQIDPCSTLEYSRRLSSLIEKITIYRKIVPEEPKDDPVYAAQMKSLSNEYLIYAQLLANQGMLKTALKYLTTADTYRTNKGDALLSAVSATFLDDVAVKRYRIFCSLPDDEANMMKDKPNSPFSPFQVEPKKESPKPKPVETVSFNAPAITTSQSTANVPGTDLNQTQLYNYSQPAMPSYTNPMQQVPTYVSPSYNQGQQILSQSQQFPGQNQYGNYAQPQQFQQQAQQSQNFYNQPYQSGGSYPPQQTQPTKPLIPQPPVMASYNQIQSPTSPATSNPANGLPPPASTGYSKASSWNDPGQDMFKSKPKKASTPAAIPPPQSMGMSAGAFSGPAGIAPPTAGFQQQQPVSAYSNQPGVMGYPQQQPAPMAGVMGQKPTTPPEAMAHPVGDRSHIPNEHRPVFESLTKLLNSCKPNAGPPQRKALDDAEKRLSILFDRLNNEKVGAEAIKILLDISKAIEAKDWQIAMAMQQALVANHGSAEGANWMLGIKRLLESAKQLIR